METSVNVESIQYSNMCTFIQMTLEEAEREQDIGGHHERLSWTFEMSRIFFFFVYVKGRCSYKAVSMVFVTIAEWN